MSEFQINLTQWIAREKLRRSRMVPLASAWFGHSLLDYTIYRLNYFALNTILVMCLHIAEFYLLTEIFARPVLHSVLLIRLGSFALGAGWWGALEIMRKRIRLLQGKANHGKLSLELGRWYMLGYGWLFLFSLIAFIYLYFAGAPDSEFHLSRIYCATIFFTLGLRFVAETKKAGVYAVSRVWRPLWSIISIPLLGLIFMSLFWWWFGTYTVVITLLLSKAISISVSLYFTGRSQNLLQYPDVILPSPKQMVVFLKGLSGREIFAAAFAFMLIDIGGILIGSVSITHHALIFGESTFLLFYFINPLLKANSDWAMLFYFDFKKHQDGILEPFLSSFTKRFLFIAFVIGTFFGCLAIIATAGYFHHDVYLISFLFLALFILRASAAFLQMIAFCEERYTNVLVCGVFVILSIIGMILANSPGRAVFILLAGHGLGIAFLVIPLLGLWVPSTISAQNLLNAHAWYARLKNETQAVQLWHFQLTPKISYTQKSVLLMQMLPKRIYRRSVWFWLDQENVLGFTSDSDPTYFFSNTAGPVTARHAGLIQSHQFSDVVENGATALQLAADLLTPGSVTASRKESDGAQLICAFQQQFPEGWCHRGRRRLHHPNFEHERVGDKYYRTLLYKITQTLRSPCECSEDLDFSISVAFPRRSAPLIFVVPHSYENKYAAADWKKSIYSWNVAQTMTG